ncbi:hypothetical protein [Streptomyces sp. NPDC017890]|uniref:hypothetical protein n=1 Tax=Streptomyces sp. NPDC017890 TaxID=3365015 RepID=UPI00379AD3B5
MVVAPGAPVVGTVLTVPVVEADRTALKAGVALIIPAEVVLTIPAGAALIIPAEVVLTIPVVVAPTAPATTVRWDRSGSCARRTCSWST